MFNIVKGLINDYTEGIELIKQ